LGSSRSLAQLWSEVMTLDLAQSIPAVEIPIYFFVGRFDHNDPADLTAQYFQHLDAPMGKQQVWFENSAHDLFFYEPQKLVQETLAILESTR
jgi:pimeloyl-ACP methyl ester carboxylesterase